MIKKTMIVMGLLGSAVCGLALAEKGTNNQTMKPAIRFEIQELREKPPWRGLGSGVLKVIL